MADANVLSDAEPDADALADVDSGATDSLVVVDVVVDAGATDSLCDSDSLVDPDALADVDSGATDSLVLCDVDSVSEALVDPVLPEVKAMLLSVARVCMFAAVASYETGVLSVTTYSPPSPRAATHRIGHNSVGIQPAGPGLQR